MAGVGLVAAGVALASGGGRSLVDTVCSGVKKCATALAYAATKLATTAADAVYGGSSSSKANNKVKSVGGSTPASPPNPNRNNKNNNNNKTGTGKAPKQGEPGSTYTQISSDGKNQIVSRTTYNEHGLPGERIDFIGRGHGGIETPHVHQFSWTKIGGIWHRCGETVLSLFD